MSCRIQSARILFSLLYFHFLVRFVTSILGMGEAIFVYYCILLPISPFLFHFLFFSWSCLGVCNLLFAYIYLHAYILKCISSSTLVSWSFYCLTITLIWAMMITIKMLFSYFFLAPSSNVQVHTLCAFINSSVAQKRFPCASLGVSDEYM